MVKSTCTFDGCDKPCKGQGLCAGHYSQRRRGQDLRPLWAERLPPRKRPLAERFWAKVQKTDECWLWTASGDTSGYGQVVVDGRLCAAHRVSWELANGPIPEGMFIDHRCHNRRCVNPEHLRLVTNAQNMQHRKGAMRNSKSGVRGVSWDKQVKAWCAYASLNGRQYWGGYHLTLEEADAAARALRARLHSHDDYEQWVAQK